MNCLQSNSDSNPLLRFKHLNGKPAERVRIVDNAIVTLMGVSHLVLLTKLVNDRFLCNFLFSNYLRFSFVLNTIVCKNLLITIF